MSNKWIKTNRKVLNLKYVSFSRGKIDANLITIVMFAIGKEELIHNNTK
jgi:hypothetical protein